PERAARRGVAAGRGLAVHHVELREIVGILRRYERREDRGQHDQPEQHEAENRDGISEEIRSDPRERRLHLARLDRSFCRRFDDDAHPLASVSRTRGSSAEYRTSTARLITMKKVTMTSRYATMTGRSSRLSESISSLPIPGHANPPSLTIANAISAPNCKPITVTIGIRMLRSTCTPITRRLVKP